MAGRAPVAHEQPRAHLLVALLVEAPQRLQQRAQIVGQPVSAPLVDLDQVAGRVAHVELDDVARELDEPVPERPVVERPVALRRPVDLLEIVDRDPQLVVTFRRQFALEQLQLRAAQRQPLYVDAEVQRSDLLCAESSI